LEARAVTNEIDDSAEVRERLRLEWKVLVDRLVSAGTPPITVLETMAEAAVEQLASTIGVDATESYFRTLTGDSKQDLTHDEAEALIEGHEPEI
jgi:hypothetical protein